MAFLDWLQTNYGTLVNVLLGLIGVGTAITGMIGGARAEGAKAIMLKISHFFSAVAPIDGPGSLSIPLTTVDIKPKETP